MHLHRVFTRGQWPPHLGGRAFPPSRGKYSAAWQKTLVDSGTPMWPDPDDPICHGEPEGVEDPLVERRRTQGIGKDQHDTVSFFKSLSSLRSFEQSSRKVASVQSACPGQGKVEKIGYIPDWITNSWVTMMSTAGKQTWDLDTWPPTQVRAGVLDRWKCKAFLINMCVLSIYNASIGLNQCAHCSGVWSLPGCIGQQREDDLQECLEDDLWVVQLDPGQSIQGWTNVLCIHTSGADRLKLTTDICSIMRF